MDMTKPYRAELKALKQAKKKVQRDYHRAITAFQTIKRLADRDAQKATRAVHKEITRIDKRIAILQGRLS